VKKKAQKERDLMKGGKKGKRGSKEGGWGLAVLMKQKTTEEKLPQGGEKD